MSDLEPGATFNTAAPLYEDVRPGYPDELIRDVLALSGIPDGGSILEVGCGTGQATEPFAARGYEMVCLDIGPDMLEIAERKLGRHPNVSVMLSAFEAWKPDREFDLVISATAFKWVDPEVRYIRARDALRADGTIATFVNLHARQHEGFFVRVQELYE